MSNLATESGSSVMSPSVECTANDCNIDTEGNFLQLRKMKLLMKVCLMMCDDVFLESVDFA